MNKMMMNKNEIKNLKTKNVLCRKLAASGTHDFRWIFQWLVENVIGDEGRAGLP